MPAEFRKLGVAFAYPENWTLEEERASGGGTTVTVYSPSGAFWSLSIQPRSVDPSRLAEAAVEAMREEYPRVEVESVEESLAGRELLGYDLHFFYLDLVSVAKVLCLRTEQGSFAVFCQAEDRDSDQLGEVFRAMTFSFLSSLKTQKLWDTV